MPLQLVSLRHCIFLQSGILIVEPNEGLLAARAMLLDAAEYYLGISSAPRLIASSRRPGHEVQIAILSESLGRDVLCSTARIVREGWPSARILVFGCQEEPIGDGLHDARMDHRARPEHLLAALLLLSSPVAKDKRSTDLRWPTETQPLPIESHPMKR